jgi:hypothetical protein
MCADWKGRGGQGPVPQNYGSSERSLRTIEEKRMKPSNVWPTQHVRRLKGVNEQSARGGYSTDPYTNLSYALGRMYDKGGLIQISQAKRRILPWLLYGLNN